MPVPDTSERVNAELIVALDIAALTDLVKVTVEPFAVDPDELFEFSFNDPRVGLSDEQMELFKANLADALPMIAADVALIEPNAQLNIGDVTISSAPRWPTRECPFEGVVDGSGRGRRAFAQPVPMKVAEVVIIPGADNFDVRFNQTIANVDANRSLSNLVVSPATIVVRSIERPRSNVLRIQVAAPIPKDTEVKVTFREVQGTGEIGGRNVTGSAVAQTFEDFKKAFLAMQASYKRSDEKLLFASGFVTTANSSTQGGADISLNPDLGIAGMTSFLQIRKSTLTGADLKNFEAGARYRAVFPTARAMFAEIGRAPADISKIREIQAAAQRGFWQQLVAGSIVDFAGKLEGMATS